MTNPSRRIRVLVGALCAAFLSLALVADAATAATSTERARKQRRRAPVDQEFGRVAPVWPALPTFGLGLPLAPVRPPDAVQKPVAAPATVAPADGSATLAIVQRAGHAGFRGSYRYPYAPGIPVSPIR